MANQQYEDGLKLLSGTKTAKELAEMGNPFGRRAGTNGQIGRQRRILGSRSMLSVLPINVRTDRLRQGLRLNQRNQGSQQVFVMSISRALVPYAKFILNPSGTVKMVTRPFWAVLEKSFKRRNFELLIKTREAQMNAT